MVENQSPTTTEIDKKDLPKAITEKSSHDSMFSFSNKKISLMVLLLLIIVSILGYLFFSWRNTSTNNKLSELINQAQKANNSGDYNTSEAKLAQALQISQDDPTALSLMITTIAAEGNQTGNEKNSFEKAKPYIDLALKTRGKNVDVLLAVGYLYETDSLYQEALQYYNQAVSLDPKSSDALFHQGHDLEFLGKRQEADSVYEKAYSLDPNNSQILMVRGNMLLSEGKAQDSFESFKKAASEPNISTQTKSEALTGASIVRRGQNNFQYMSEALAISKQAVDADPTFSPALATYGYNLILTGKNEEGITYLQKAIAANPRITRNYYQLALVYRVNKNYADAINYMKQAISLSDNDNTLFSLNDRKFAKGTYTYELAKTYSLSGLNVNTLPLLIDALQLNPNLKQDVKNDSEKYGLFKNLVGNQTFKTLIE